MKKYKFLLIFVLFVNVLIANDKIEFTEKEKSWLKNNPVLTYSEVNWKPLSIIEDNRMKGIMGEYLDVISLKTGIKFKFTPSSSWPDVLERFSRKEIDIVPGIGSSPQEMQLGLISREYATYPMVIVTKDKYKYLDGLKDLSGKTIAIPKYYTSYNFVVKNHPDITVIPTKSILEALLLVENGKAEAFVGHIATSLYYIAENYLDNLKVTGTTSFIFEHHYLIQKDNPILLSIINKVFDSITHEEKKKIYSKWIQTSVVEEKIDYTLIVLVSLFFIFIIGFISYRHFLIKAAHNDLTNVLNSTLDGIMISKNRICINANEPFLDKLKYKKEELVGKNILDIIVPEYYEKVEEYLSQDKSEPYELKVILSDGKTIPMLVKGTNLLFNGEKVRVSSFVDLSETKDREALLHQQTKMAAMGEMISNIAHQWRQPITTISMNANNILADIELEELDEKVIKESMISITDQTEYLSKTIDDFRDFFNPEKKEKKLVSTDELIDSTFKIVNPQLVQKEIRMFKDIDSFEISVIKNEIIQILINILNNAKDALEKVDSEKFIFINLKKDENNLVIEIYDNAGGIPTDIIDRIFEPYFTTKHQSRGTGIGLYMTEEIITKHLNGEIIVSNKEYTYQDKSYKGASFNIRFPV